MLLFDRQRQVKLFNDLKSSINHHSSLGAVWAIEQGVKLQNEDDKASIAALVSEKFSAPKDEEEKALICRLLHLDVTSSCH